jgi:hypothetical protein
MIASCTSKVYDGHNDENFGKLLDVDGEWRGVIGVNASKKICSYKDLKKIAYVTKNAPKQQEEHTANQEDADLEHESVRDGNVCILRTFLTPPNRIRNPDISVSAQSFVFFLKGLM